MEKMRKLRELFVDLCNILLAIALIIFYVGFTVYCAYSFIQGGFLSILLCVVVAIVEFFLRRDDGGGWFFLVIVMFSFIICCGGGGSSSSDWGEVEERGPHPLM